MKKSFLSFLRYALLISLTILLMKVFLPRYYDVPSMPPRAATQYWVLPTGSKIAYTYVAAKGQEKPFPIIYLHGGPGGCVFERNITLLSTLSEDGYALYFYDQIGGGLSGRLADISQYTVERHIKDLKAIIDKTGAGKAILIGQSWGAVLAALFAAGYPEKVDQLIFTSPGPIYPVHIELAYSKAPDSLSFRAPYFSNRQGNEKANNLRTKAMALLATTFHQKLASDKEADDFATYLNFELNKSTLCDTSKISTPETGYGFYASIMTYQNLLQVQDPRPEIKKSNIPVLVIKGQCDNQQWGFTHEYLTLFDHHQLAIIPDAGHAISLEQPELYMEAIRRFLRE
jgi:proline iminopeptidase